MCRQKDIMLKLYKVFVRPHLEYCVQAWSPYLKKNIELIEKVQHRFTKMMPGLSVVSYEVRLSWLKLTTLETRRVRGDLIQAFKIIKGIDELDP